MLLTTSVLFVLRYVDFYFDFFIIKTNEDDKNDKKK